MLVWGFMFMQANMEGHISELDKAAERLKLQSAELDISNPFKAGVWMQGWLCAHSEEIQKTR